MGAGKKVQQERADGKVDKRDPEKLAQRRALFANMRVLADSCVDGSSDEELTSSSGAPLNPAEKQALAKLLPRARHVDTGRRYRVMRSGDTVDVSYACGHNLAGTVYLLTVDGVLTEVPLYQDAERCGHMLCRHDDKLKSGGRYDGVVLTVPSTYAELGHEGVFSEKGVGSREVWQANYHLAVLATKYMRARMPLPKYRALMGTSFVPKTQFGEAIVLMLIASRGTHLTFSYYHDYYVDYDAWVNAVPCSTDRLRKVAQLLLNKPVVKMSNYSWAFHHWCRIKSMFPDVKIYIPWFSDSVDYLSRQSLAKTQTVLARYEVGQRLTFNVRREVIDVDRNLLEQRRNECLGVFVDISFPIRSGADGVAVYHGDSRIRDYVDCFLSCSDDNAFNRYYQHSGLFPRMLDLSDDMIAVVANDGLVMLRENWDVN